MNRIKGLFLLIGGFLLSGCVATMTPRGEVYTELIASPAVVVEPTPVLVRRPSHPPRPMITRTHHGHFSRRPSGNHPGPLAQHSKRR